MNEAQLTLISWIIAGLNIPGVLKGAGDANYLLSNMVAKVSLASDEYRVSEAALKELKERGFDISQPITRSRIYGKKNGFVFEHSTPCSIIRKQLLAEPERAEEIMKDIGFVAIITREEDERLNKQFKNSFPTEGTRYDAVGIQLAEEFVKMKGAIQR